MKLMILSQTTSNTDNELIKTLSNSLESLKSGQLNEALSDFLILKGKGILKEKGGMELGEIVESGIRCCKYWIDKFEEINKNGEETDYEKGIALINELQIFEKNNINENENKKVINSVISSVLLKIIGLLKDDLGLGINNDSVSSLYLIALSYKKIGDYKNAIKYLEEVVSKNKNDANGIALLADCYDLISETDKAKVLFREAFFINPQIIDLKKLESTLILNLLSNLKAYGFDDNDLVSFIPVYGRVLGFFNVYRELFPVELKKIENEIFLLENSIKETTENNQKKAKLINCYLWLYDYYTIKESGKDMLLFENKIKNMSVEIYEYLKKQKLGE